ncbi:MAG TPA: PilZ domain-containing protein [Bryobacteraceae bacterium]|nr:PilZ domain-containing protein [Bryobacteraceae bacterium]
MQERRNEGRMMCADMIELFWRDPSGKRHRTMALLEDISPSGACLQLERPITPGATLCWTSQQQRLEGTVRYCVYREIGYFAGVEFEPGMKWSETLYHPQHMFDPSRLLEK